MTTQQDNTVKVSETFGNAAQSYATGMSLYSMKIGLQEAHRWLMAGYNDMAKFQTELAQKQLEEIIEKYENRNK